MEIDGLDEKQKPEIEELGTFKLKDRAERRAVEIDFGKVKRSLSEAKCLYIAKIRGKNNLIKVSIHWKPTEKDAKKN